MPAATRSWKLQGTNSLLEPCGGPADPSISSTETKLQGTDSLLEPCGGPADPPISSTETNFGLLLCRTVRGYIWLFQATRFVVIH